MSVDWQCPVFAFQTYLTVVFKFNMKINRTLRVLSSLPETILWPSNWRHVTTWSSWPTSSSGVTSPSIQTFSIRFFLIIVFFHGEWMFSPTISGVLVFAQFLYCFKIGEEHSKGTSYFVSWKGKWYVNADLGVFGISAVSKWEAAGGLIRNR